MRDGKLMIFNAGSLFTDAQRNERLKEGRLLREMFPDLVVDNPVDFDINSSVRPPNAAVFASDYAAQTASDFVIFELDSWDSGTHMEFGLMVEQALHNKKKYLFPILSDFRIRQGILKGEIPGFGMNEMLTGTFYYPPLNEGDVPQLTLCSSHEMARNAIKAILTGDTANYRERFDVKNMYHDDSMYHGFDSKGPEVKG